MGKWSVRDVITVVLLSAVLIVIQLAVNMLTMPSHFMSMVMSVGFSMLLCGPVYSLLVSRVNKRGSSLVYMTILGSIYFLMGNWYLLFYLILVGVVCEAVLWKENSSRNSRRVRAAWTAASFLYNGINLLPILFFWDSYYSFAVKSGMEQGYIDSYRYYFTSPGWLAAIVLFTTLCGWLGSLVGGRLIEKHFKKAGIL